MYFDKSRKLFFGAVILGSSSVLPSIAIAQIAICTNYESFNSESLARLSKFLDKSYGAVYINDSVIEVEKILQAKIYIAPPINSDIRLCIASLGINYNETISAIAVISDRLGREKDLFPKGTKGRVLQASEDLYVDGLPVRISVSNAPEPLRSIIAMTSIFEIDDTSCVSNLECIKAVENP